MKKLIRLTEGDLHRIVTNSVKKVLKEDFENDYNQARDNYLQRKSPSGMWGMEMKNPEGDWEYGEVSYDPQNQTMSCMGATIQVDPDMSVDDNLQALYDELTNQGYTDGDE